MHVEVQRLIGIMETKMETAIVYWGYIVFSVSRIQKLQTMGMCRLLLNPTTVSVAVGATVPPKGWLSELWSRLDGSQVLADRSQKSFSLNASSPGPVFPQG